VSSTTVATCPEAITPVSKPEPVGVDEGHGLPEVDGQLAGNESAGVVADDANFHRAFGHCTGNLNWLFVAAAAIIRVARPTVVPIVSAVTRVVVIFVLGKREPTPRSRRGPEQ
jgi:hypothetical protein